MSKKCDNCKKAITKATPGIECSRCEKLVHLITKCTGLSSKQLTALKAATSLEWTCLTCQQESPRRRSSIIMPEDDDDEEEDERVQVNANQFLHNVTKEVEKTIKKELREINDSLQFHSAKLDEVVTCIEAFKKNIKALEKKNIELTHKNNHLETRVGALEQRIQEMEQNKLSKCIEIANVPFNEKENVKLMAENIATHLKVPIESIKCAQRNQGNKTNTANITVELINGDDQDKWLTAAKNIKTTVANVKSSDKNNQSLVYIREAMTKLNKQIFWNAKQNLKISQNFKYVWFKKGYVRARKDDAGKTYILRSLDDVLTISNQEKQIN